jgi:nicotinamide riboside kinase
VEALVIWVVALPADAIPGYQRYACLKNTFPDLDIRLLLPGANGNILPIDRCPPPQVVFTSAVAVANESANAGIPHHPLDLPQSVNTSQHPLPQSQFSDILPEARPLFVRRIALLGPESSGKSFLAEKLAAHYQTVWVEEYGRTYTEKMGPALTPLDFAHIAGGQLYLEDEKAREANYFLFCDTELLTTQTWSEMYFDGTCQPWIVGAALQRQYDHHLLLTPDIDWVADGIRAYPQKRAWHFDRLHNLLSALNLPFTIVSGNADNRWTRCLSLLDNLK